LLFRYFTVCHPFYYHAKAWSPMYYVVPILTFAFGFNIPKFFELETQRTEIKHEYNETDIGNVSFVEGKLDRFGRGHLFVQCVVKRFRLLSIVNAC